MIFGLVEMRMTHNPVGHIDQAADFVILEEGDQGKVYLVYGVESGLVIDSSYQLSGAGLQTLPAGGDGFARLGRRTGG